MDPTSFVTDRLAGEKMQFDSRFPGSIYFSENRFILKYLIR